MDLNNKPKININRNTLQSFLKDNETIKKFEELLRSLNDLVPEDLENLLLAIEENLNLSDYALNKLNSLNGLINTIKIEIERLKLTNRLNTKPKLDYIDLNINPTNAPQVGRIAWNIIEDTLNVYHKNGIIQQVGQELFMQVKNTTGSTLLNGSSVSFAGTSGDILIQNYIANGTISNLYFIGLLTQDILNNEVGKVTLYGNVRGIDTTGLSVGEIWLADDILYASATTAGKLTKVRPTAPNEVVVVAVVRVVDSINGELLVRPTIPQGLKYGRFSDTTDQSLTSANTVYSVKYNTSNIASGISVVSNSRVTISESGLYSILSSLQVTSSNASTVVFYTWLSKNGSNVANTRRDFTFKANGDTYIINSDYLISLAKNDYIEIKMATTSTGVALDAKPTLAFAPAAPSATLTINQTQL